MKHVFSQYSIEFRNSLRAENNSVMSYKNTSIYNPIAFHIFLLRLLEFRYKTTATTMIIKFQSNKLKLFLKFTAKTIQSMNGEWMLLNSIRNHLHKSVLIHPYHIVELPMKEILKWKSRENQLYFLQ